MPPTAETGLSENLFCKKARLPVAFFIHKQGKHDHAIYGAAKVQTSKKTNQPTCQQTLISRLLPQEESLRHI